MFFCSYFYFVLKKRKHEKIVFIDFYTSFYEYLIPTVNTDAGAEPNATNSTVNEDMSDDESAADDQQVKKKSKKEKVGFRDRKVLPNYLQQQQHHTFI